MKIEFGEKGKKSSSFPQQTAEDFSVVYSTDYNAMNGQSVMIQNNWMV
jgi:hypothetical protein